MRARAVIALVGLSTTFLVATSAQQTSSHLNPMIDLLAAKKPILGLGVPTAGRQGGGNRGGRAGAGGQATGAAVMPATPAPPPKTPAELAQDALAHPEADFFFTAMMERNVDAGEPVMIALQDAIAAAGPVSTTTPRRLLVPVNSKAPNIWRPEPPATTTPNAADRTMPAPPAAAPADPNAYIANISRQLNAGVSSFSFVEVDNADELKKGIAAMRFASKGGTRPENVGNAPKYWGLTEAEYRRKADVWPLNPEGELVVWAIIESREGLENIREIAQVPGLSVMAAGAGTLGGVFSTTNAEGRRVRDDVAWEAAIQKILATCKEFKLACAYPVTENDVETRMNQGFNVAILQAFNDAAFRTLAKGRQVGGR